MSLKTMTATVGQGCSNIPADVATVQFLLNSVPVSAGGPINKLKIDGFAGVLTIEAINRFQKTHFGLSNSRVQSGEATFNELKKYDPFPFSGPVIRPKFVQSAAEKMDPSKMNFGIRNIIPNFGPNFGRDALGKSIEGGGIKARLYAGVNDDGI